MTRYIVRHLAGLIPVFFGITLISFLVMHLAPGGPSDISSSMNPKVSYEARIRLDKLYGLDKPLIVQYKDWLVRVVRFDFGRSFIDDRPVFDKIIEKMPVTIFINLSSLVIILAVGIPIGALSAVRRNGLFDRFSAVFVFAGYSIPEFWLALLLMSVFGISLHWLPISGIKSIDFEYYSLPLKILDVARHLVLPVLLASFGGLAGISRYMRSSMSVVMRQEYIRTARAKGLPERKVIYVHALKNAILPVITILGLSVPALIGGSVIFESIFAIPGMGRLFYESVMARDYSVIMGILSIGAILTLAGNFIADMAYSFADPRIMSGGDGR